MLLPTLQEWHHSSFMREGHWLSLQPGAPSIPNYGDMPLHLHHLSLPPQELAAYARTKEKLWADIHGLPSPPWGVDDFRFYGHFNWINSDALLESTRKLDIAYIHDFQLMQLGALIGLAAPSVLRWHVPFDPTRIPAYTRRYLVKAMEDFDAVIVSTRRDLEGLVKAGYHGEARQIYPHIDSHSMPDPKASDIRALEDRWRLSPDSPLILCVARMDPMKRQDIAIEAFARLRHKHPKARLALIGNGTFSAAKQGGLGLSKAHEWRRGLEGMAKRLGVAPEVIFAGHVQDDLLNAAYARSDVVVLPSDIEGFGLTTLEGWRYGKPSIVSRGAGSAEIVHDGLNGLVFPAGDVATLSDQLDRLLTDSETRLRMGEAGRATLRSYDVKEAAGKEREVLTSALEGFRT
ncbi:MAG: glycosyltransferase family 4 protein [Candidatus Thermoplasmatota archaeon]